MTSPPPARGRGGRDRPWRDEAPTEAQRRPAGRAPLPEQLAAAVEKSKRLPV
ncbi:hypothetical protein [Streptomyces sp. NPDC059142]|uniref:hypothetical protein n=1 Tax=Streptomyces sp. NPDC059142 TaxID=3346739 RepID=UPI0036A20F08